MHRRAILLTAVVLAFGLGLFKLLLLRFEAGDIYPAYSSLRSDPLGTKAFYTALRNLETLTVERHFQPGDKIVPDAGLVVFLVGLPYQALNQDDPELLHLIRGLKQAGGRLVLAFYPKGPKRKEQAPGPETEQKTGPAPPEGSCGKKNKTCPSRGTAGQAPPGIKLAEYLGLAFDLTLGQAGKGGKFTAVREDTIPPSTLADSTAAPAPELPPSIPWHSALVLEPRHPDWRVIYSIPKAPVIIVRKLGKGEIVLLSDAFLFSNEALRSERHPALLAWLLQGKSRVLFGEFHLGNVQSMGMVDLLIRYRLYGLLPALVLLGVLLVWKNSTAFLPRQKGRSAPNSNEYTSNRDYTQGLISLLRRHISSKDLLSAGFQEWLKSAAAGRRVPPEKLEKIKGLMTEHSQSPGRAADPLQTYCAVSKILSERKKT